MPQSIIDLNPISRITIEALGEPGQRTFYIQGRQGHMLVTLLIEKEQAQAMAIGLEQIMAQLAQQNPDSFTAPDEVLVQNMALEEPLTPLFRVGQMGLGYDEKQNLLVLVLQELLAENQNPETASLVRFWFTPLQAHTLAIHTLEVVAAGRPTCPLCGAPLEPDAEHFCPRKNGHNKPQA
jgi:uncharacterized repeat protein (TIGR03847 family)